MLESLENLRCIVLLGDDGKKTGKTLADEIQAEIDRFYLPRPLFEDGKPAQFGDEYLGNDGIVRKVTSIRIFDDRSYWVFGGCVYHDLVQGERLKRPPEPDTQDKIDGDLMLSPCEYCDKRGLNAVYDPKVMSDEWPNIVMRRDLLARQRKLDGVE